jgi:hypothetical protein
MLSLFPKHSLKLGDKVVFLTDSSSPFKLLFYSSESLKNVGRNTKENENEHFIQKKFMRLTLKTFS